MEKYPRRSTIRLILKSLAKLATRILLRVKITGLENFPKSGPYIVVGNHVSSLEPILMVAFTPHQVEFLGTGDIPIDPRMSFITNLYKFIPVMRGQIDQTALNSALEVLTQNGVLGIFPEGGIWEKGLKEPKIGTSWISYKSKSPILPIGFIGMNRGLERALSLKRPKVSINIGKLVTYDEIFDENLPLKTRMVQGSIKIMEKIADLLPEEEIISPSEPEPNKLVFTIYDGTGTQKNLNFPNMNDLCKLIEHPIIMDVFSRNLRLPVKPLLDRNKLLDIEDYGKSLMAILDYLNTNPGFLSYRFGIDQAIQMKTGLENLLELVNQSKLDFIKMTIRLIDK